MTASSNIDTPTITCPPWCERQSVDCGDHWANPGSERWPTVRATGWPAKGIPTLTAHPTWGEVDRLAPAVTIWLYGDDQWELDESIDLTPAEAIAVAHNLLRAAEAAKAV